MRLVVDASVALNWLVVKEDADVARELATSGQDLHAPHLMASEIANALWRKVQVGDRTPRRGCPAGQRTGHACVRGADEIVSADSVRLALTFDHPVYDCMYLALAHCIGASVVAADLRFANAVAPAEHGRSVLTLADHSRTG